MCFKVRLLLLGRIKHYSLTMSASVVRRAIMPIIAGIRCGSGDECMRSVYSINSHVSVAGRFTSSCIPHPKIDSHSECSNCFLLLAGDP